MKAGRELDALIAEKVMGRKIEWEHYAAGSRPMVNEEDMSLYMAPRYSTQIADAWGVVDAKEWELQMVVHKRGKHKGETGAILSFDLFMEERDGVLGDTPSHAICLAALKAIE